MGTPAENKILLLLKQGKREDENEANRLLKILRGRTKTSPFTPLPKPEVEPPAPAEVLSLPGLSALHLFSYLKEETRNSLDVYFQNKQDGWLRYFLAIQPLAATEVAGLPHLSINQEMKEYQDKLRSFLHRLLIQWRLKKPIVPEQLKLPELDEMLIHLIGKLKILVQQGRFQQISTLDSCDKRLTFLCILKPEGFNAPSKFLQKSEGTLLAHLAFLVAVMAQEVVILKPGQLKEAIAVGESLQKIRENLTVFVHRMAVRSQFGQVEPDGKFQLAGVIERFFESLNFLFKSEEKFDASGKGG